MKIKLEAETVGEALEFLNQLLIFATPDQRLTLFEHFTKGFCKHCGDVRPSGDCQCTNDE